MQIRANFHKNTIFFTIILLICFLHLSKNSRSQEYGSPYIQRIILDNYGFKNNNFSMVQDQSGVLYISNSNGILQFDGNYWRLIKFQGIPKLAVTSNGTLFAGAQNQFGYFESDESSYRFISLLDSSQLHLDKTEQIEKLIAFDDKVYFHTRNKLFIYHDGMVELIKESNTELELFCVNNQLMVESLNENLFKLVGTELLILPHSTFFKDKNIIDMLPLDGKVLIKTEKEKGFYLFDNYEITSFNTQIDAFLEQNIYKTALALNNKYYVIGTEMAGIAVIDKKGSLVCTINDYSGLYSFDINHLFIDKNNTLWALHNKALSRIEINSPYRYYNKNHGLQGNISSVIRFKGNLYVATSKGVFYWPRHINEKMQFEKIPQIRSNCFEFHLLDNQLFVSGADGIYEIKNHKASLFYNREAEEITSVLHSKQHPDLIFLGQKDGLHAIRYVEEILIIEKKLEGIDAEISSIAEDADGTLWLTNNLNEVYRVDPFDKYQPKLPYTLYHPGNKLPGDIDWIHLYPIKNAVLFSTSNGIYRYSSADDSFYQDTLLGVDFTTKSNWVYPIVEDSEGNIWFNIIEKTESKNLSLVKYCKSDTLIELEPLPINRIQDLFISSIHPDDDGIIWFGGFEGLVSYDLNKEIVHQNEIDLLFNRIIIGKDSVVYQLPIGKSLETTGRNVYQYKFNDILFEFSSPDFESEEQIYYQYRLEGFDNHWSAWTNTHFKEYTNLYEGKYTFKLRSKNMYGEISPLKEFLFEIKAPYYRSNIAFLLYIITLTLLFVLISKWREYFFAKEKFRLENIINERTEEVVLQKEKADNLLERVLPKNTAKDLKSGRKAGPYHYNMVTVLFSDIQGFTKISEQMESELLIDELDKFFLKFDTVVEKFNIEKIKTIGDAYMCAGGIPVKNRTNPVEVVLAAIEMQLFMKELKRTSDKSTSHIWDLRIGIDTGPVVAGVLGRSKISYDIWGGTVNTASRMEASGEAGKINITENTYMLIKDFFICQYRGKMPVKYKGEIDMYFVEGFKPHLSSDLKSQIPNANFFTQLQLLRVNDVEEFVLSKLEEGLPNNLYYHNIKHTIDVVTQVELIGRSEGVNDEEILMLKTAALFHDMGHLVNYDTHEEESVKLAKKILPEYQYSQQQINTICDLISATQMPPRPKNLLEEIMCDADLDYLGRTDFVPVSINLYKELHERNKIDSILEWNQMQLDFIKKHHYFTKTAQKLREVNKKNQLEVIREEIKRELEQADE